MPLVLLACGCGHLEVTTSAYYERDRHDGKEGIKVEVKELF
jgi:hypothetical protein